MPQQRAFVITLELDSSININPATEEQIAEMLMDAVEATGFTVVKVNPFAGEADDVIPQ